MKILEDDEQLYKELEFINEKMRRRDSGIIYLSEINSDEFFEKDENEYISLCDLYYNILKYKFPEITIEAILEEEILEKYYSDERELNGFKNHNGYRIYISINSIRIWSDDYLLEPIMLYLNSKVKIKEVIL